MKRILLLALGMFSGAVLFSQNDIKILSQDRTHYINDSVITVYGQLPTREYNAIAGGVINTSASSMTIAAKWHDSVIAPFSKNALCWKVCPPYYTFIDYTSPYTETVGASDTDFTFEGHDSAAAAGTEIIRFQFWNTANVNDTAWVIYKFIIAPLGVEQITGSTMHMSAPYPNPANSNVSVSYNLNGVKQASFKVYNTIGQCVQAQNINSESTKLNVNVAGLPAGIYICKLEASEANPVFQKLIVTH